MKPLLSEWMQRFEQLGIFGTASMMEFEGVVMFEVTVEEDAFQAIALREEWTLPPEVRLYLGFSRDTRKNAPQNSNNSFGAMT